MLEYILEYLR